MKEYIIRTDLEIKTCQDCPLVIRHKNGSTTCPIKKGSERKYGTCILAELPPHGRLIDADAFKEASKDKSIKCALTIADGTVIGCDSFPLKLFHDWIDKTPTILKSNK